MSPKPPIRLSLTDEWLACIVFQTADDQAALREVADRLSREYSAEVTERYGFPEGSKEYWWLRVQDTTLLLLRKDSIGLSLAGERRDNALVSRIAADWDAVPTGWRCRLWRCWRRCTSQESR